LVVKGVWGGGDRQRRYDQHRLFRGAELKFAEGRGWQGSRSGCWGGVGPPRRSRWVDVFIHARLRGSDSSDSFLNFIFYFFLISGAGLRQLFRHVIANDWFSVDFEEQYVSTRWLVGEETKSEAGARECMVGCDGFVSEVSTPPPYS